MPCYCGKISALRTELTNLDTADFYASSLDLNYTFQYIAECAMYYEDDFSIMDTQHTNADEIRDIYGKVYSSLGDVRARLNAVRTEINNDITSYSSWDRAYHKQQEAK